ncbi:TPA: hypothetical protein K8J16_001150 [Serratia marcescens]|uniref:BRO-N domain-containing protein n=1 Tax=Serratia marcescens TaxID=615 RepID=UPI001C76C854|nr:BRO family protein [Serratia marcescens]BCZ39817.1 hypothetical protein SMGES_11430 [Serratia marcescens]HBI6266451.1 hypothetical protein [Serratia marcescens]HBI6947660.1 hypothetical protein [Serratia marcescens]
MTALAINSVEFDFESQNIRTVIIENEAWFIAEDVCRTLKLSNPSMSLKSLDDDERSKLNLGRQGEANIINESGLYTLILRCRDAVKQGTLPWRFRKWVTNEVLPTIRKTGRYEKQPTAEPLSPKDMGNLTRLVWLMTSGMKFERAWSAGIWHCLRSVTGRPSPQPFSVNDLPALGEECRRILKITSAFNSVIYDFEKEVIRTVVRRRGNIEPLVDKMKGQMVELLDNERSGLLSIDKLCDSGVKELINRQ